MCVFVCVQKKQHGCSIKKVCKEKKKSISSAYYYYYCYFTFHFYHVRLRGEVHFSVLCVNSFCFFEKLKLTKRFVFVVNVCFSQFPGSVYNLSLCVFRFQQHRLQKIQLWNCTQEVRANYCKSSSSFMIKNEFKKNRTKKNPSAFFSSSRIKILVFFCNHHILCSPLFIITSKQKRNEEKSS